MGTFIWSKVTGVANTDVTMTMAFGGTRFVGVQRFLSTNTYVHSTDAVTWDDNDTLPVTATWSTIAFGASIFVLARDEVTSSYYTSTDGLTWTSRTFPASMNNARVYFANSLFLAIPASAGTTGYTSSDGISWTAFTLPLSADWLCITHGAGTYLATRAGGYAYSTDLITWTDVTSSLTEYACAFGNSTFVRACDDEIYYSTDTCVTWTAANISGAFAPPYVSSRVVYATGTTVSSFFAFSEKAGVSRILSSPNGSVWVDEGNADADCGFVSDCDNGTVMTYGISGAMMKTELLNIEVLADTLNATEAFEALITAFFASAANGSDALAAQSIMNINDVAEATFDSVTAGTLFSTLLDFIETRDELRQLVYGVLTDNANATEALASFYQQIELLRARVHAVDTMLSSQTVEMVLLAAATTLDMIASGYDADLVDAASATYTLAAALQANAALLAEADATAVQTNSIIFSTDMVDEAQADAALDAAAQFRAFLEAGGEASVYLRLAGEDYTAWVLNLDNIAVTEYRNYEFNSFADFNGTYYGAADDGLYTLGGDTDAGATIPAWIRSGLSNYGSGAVKRMPMMYVGYTAANGLVLKVAVTDKGVKTEHWFRLEARTADATRADRAKIGKGLAAVYWQWELHNIDGGDFDIDTLRLWPMVLTRRVR